MTWDDHKNAMIVLSYAFDEEISINPHLVESQSEDTVQERWWKSLAAGSLGMVPEENEGESQ